MVVIAPEILGRKTEDWRAVVKQDKTRLVEMTGACFRKVSACETPSGIAVEMRQRRWGRKSWVNRRGGQSGGGWFTKETLRRLLSSPLFIGKVAQDGQLIAAHSQSEVEKETFASITQQIMSSVLNSAKMMDLGSQNDKLFREF